MNYTLGESLLDVIFDGLEQVVAKPGGSMLNTAVSLARMNLPVTHISELGDNEVAKLMLEFLNKNGVITDYIRQYPEQNTSMALAFLDQRKKPTYQFINGYPPLRTLSEIPAFNANDYLLFGSMYSISQAIRPDILRCVHKAGEAGSLIMYDPNIRHKHHLEDAHLKTSMMENLKLADIIKASDEDCANLFGEAATAEYLKQIRQINKNALICITLGEKGALASLNNRFVTVKAVETRVVSTIGAGDAFSAGVLYQANKLQINTRNISQLSEKELLSLLQSGTTTAARVCATYDNYVPPLAAPKF